MQVIGIIFVVLCHSFHEYPDGFHGQTLFVYRLGHLFVMSMFLFISGFLMIYSTRHNPRKQTPGKFILSKVKRLLIPMVVLTAITFVPRALMSFAADDNVTLTGRNLLLAFIDKNYMPIPFFWYIHVCFILLCGCFLTIYLFGKLHIKPLVTIFVILIALLAYTFCSLPGPTLFSFSHLKLIGSFFALGAIYAFFYDRIDRYIPWENFYFLGFIIFALLLSFHFFESTKAVIICRFFGILMCISLSKILVKYEWNFLDNLTGANYIIFLLSWYFNIAFQQVLAHYVELPWYVHTLLSLFAGLYIPWLGYKYLEKHQDSRWVRFTSAMLGQTFRQTTHHTVDKAPTP